MLQIAFGRITQILLLVITTRVATTLLPPAEMARVFLISSAAALYALLLLSPVGMFMNRRLHAWNASGKVKHYYNYFWLYLLGVCVFAIASLTMLVNAKLLAFHMELDWLLLLVFFSLLITSINQIVIPGLNLLGHRIWFVYLTLATTATSLVLAILIVEIGNARAEYWIVGILTGQLLIACFGWKIFYQKIATEPVEGTSKISLNNNHIKTMWKFSWPIFISAGLVWVQTQSYRFFMEGSLGLANVGLFVAGYGISAGIISAFELVFTTYLQPIFYKQVSSGDRIEQSKAWKNYASVIFPSLFMVWFFVIASAPELTRLLLGDLYKDSSQFVQWGAVAELARVTTSVYGMVAHARMKTKLLLVPNAIGSVISISLILLLMPKFGALGVGAALALAGIAVLVATFVATRSELDTVLPYASLLQSGVCGVALVVVALIARKFIAEVGMVSTVMLLSLLAAVFLLGQYWILKPLLYGQGKTNE